MSLKDDLSSEVNKFLVSDWEVTKGRVVPATSDVGLGTKAVLLEKAVVFYADMSGSTKMVDGYKWWFSAGIYKSYLLCAAKIVKANGGDITAYDGDRIMAVFIGENKFDNSAKAGLQLNWAVKAIVNEAIKRKWPNQEFSVAHTVGIDVSDLHVARTGVRGDNDLVWVGRAANHAAKLTDLDTIYSTWITKDAYLELSNSVQTSSDGRSMWVEHRWTKMNDLAIYGSTWWWPF